MAAINAPSSTALRSLDDAYYYFTRGDVELGKDHFEKACVELANAKTKVSKYLWIIQGRPPACATDKEDAFFDRNQRTSTVAQKILALNTYRESLYRSGVLRLESDVSSCPSGPSDSCSRWESQMTFVSRILEEKLVHILSPSGRYVHAIEERCVGDGRWGASRCSCYGGEEVLPRYEHIKEGPNPYHPRHKDLRYRPFQGFGYTQAGYVRIGKFLVDPLEREDVRMAQLYTEAREQEPTCVVS